MPETVIRLCVNPVTIRTTIVVESISRFARNTRDLLELMEQLNAKGIGFVSKKEAIAKQAGKYKGRKPIDRTALQPILDEYRKGSLTAAEAMRKMNVSKSTFYRMFQQKNNESFKRS
ncbi:recombinase family protein [Ruthenibacterium sp. CLA-JM-H11]|uniref:Recombinase family protein n=1 Tax=Ruthenibacterium intestinale TaxID=3133163 RepID=A0ABV1GIG9_9FIRM